MGLLNLALVVLGYVCVYLLPALLSSKVLVVCIASFADSSDLIYRPTITSERHLQHWMTYWGLLLVLELSWFAVLRIVVTQPVYQLTRISVCLFLSLPSTMGAGRIYGGVLKPLWTVHRGEVERKVSDAKYAVLKGAVNGLIGALTGGFRSLRRGHHSSGMGSQSSSARASMSELGSGGGREDEFVDGFMELLSGGLYVFARPAAGEAMTLMVFCYEKGGFRLQGGVFVKVEAVRSVEEDGERGVKILYTDEVKEEKEGKEEREGKDGEDSDEDDVKVLEVIVAESRERVIFVDGVRGIVRRSTTT